MEAEGGVPEQECKKQDISNAGGVQRRSPERPGGKGQLVFGAQYLCFNYRSNIYIRHTCYNRDVFVWTKKKPIIKQHSTQIKKLSDTVVRREDDEM